MKKMVKKAISLVMAAILCIVGSGCGARSDVSFQSGWSNQFSSDRVDNWCIYFPRDATDIVVTTKDASGDETILVSAAVQAISDPFDHVGEESAYVYMDTWMGDEGREFTAVIVDDEALLEFLAYEAAIIHEDNGVCSGFMRSVSRKSVACYLFNYADAQQVEFVKQLYEDGSASTAHIDTPL